MYKIHHPTGTPFGYVEKEGIETLKEAWDLYQDLLNAFPSENSFVPDREEATSSEQTKPSKETKPSSSEQLYEGNIIKMGDLKKSATGKDMLRLRIKTADEKEINFYLFNEYAMAGFSNLSMGDKMAVIGTLKEEEYKGRKYLDIFPAIVKSPDLLSTEQGEQEPDDIPF